MKKKTKKNPKGCGRDKMFKKKFGETKRIQVSIPTLEEETVRIEFNKVLEPYKL